ncbi:MAG TPA: type II toxin-antitoxin system VapC family toxin [Aliidongia sp.]|uniref:type II toxin-antitoxin system VapC family toxin n=1 Tax=Aliidongia sp. TaxID=1914230 RepID=UPI002DDCF213|nr:type II toxin-antitoxin system VapC family toxin [Aliidongia sp.]HEV2676969.1 type II toxin-antitoxin system VapC family toxin [Aliidongia sp.]
MRLLLDTHAFLWWLAGDDALSGVAKAAIADEANEILVSAVSAWEMATKHRIGKLPGLDPIADDLEAAIAGQGFRELAISLRHGRVAGGLPGPHRDPFDRMLIAQAMLDGLVLVSNEKPFDAYGVSRLW